MFAPGILTEEFARVAAKAGLRARESALAAGHSVVFMDSRGRYIEEQPDGRLLEVRLQPGTVRESHVFVIGELTKTAE
ncbi:MAG: hypothetical protein C5B51_27930 [Terriglobia bacterium]|nr:MAG: hypothetical protein C5B51_27930 [Terriglobia bacterium]